MTPQFLTVAQFVAKYRIDRHTVYKLVREKNLHGVFLSPKKLRVEDPGYEHMAQVNPHPSGRPRTELADAARFLRACEAAALMGITPDRVKQLAQQGKIGCMPIGHRRLYSIDDIVERKTRMAGAAKATNPNGLRPWVVTWALERLKARGVIGPNLEQMEAEGEIEIFPKLKDIDSLIDQIRELPEEAREQEWQALLRTLTQKVRVKRLLQG